MTKKIIIICILILVLAGFGYVFLVKNDTVQQSNVSSTSVNNSVVQPSNVSNTETVNSGKYIEYDSDLVNKTTGRRVLFFHAPWCSQCRELDSSLKNGQIPDGVTIFKTDYDSNQKLRQRYGVTLQTTLVLLDDKGDLLKKYVSYEEPNLQAVIKNLL